MNNTKTKTSSAVSIAKVRKIELEQTKLAVNKYLQDNVVSDFSLLPVATRMTFLQDVPKQFIKERDIKNVKLPYIDHFFAERVLNFISNFRWGSEKLDSTIVEKEVKTRNGVKTMFEATVEMKMWIYIGENRIERYIASGHNAYENPATTKADALQSAISKANTKFARQLGLGADLNAKESNAYDKIEQYYEDVELVGKGEKPRKKLTDKQFEHFLNQTDDYIEEKRHLVSFTPEQEKKLERRLA
jgi:predicted nucleic acid-binding Zn finger protein